MGNPAVNYSDIKSTLTMLTYQEAEQLAVAWVAICTADQAVLVTERTMTKPYGWVFFYQSRAYLQTGDEGEILLGNAPIIIDRVNGEVRVTGTARPIEKYLTEFEASLAKRNGKRAWRRYFRIT
ncbi:MAG: YrhB domain-containing protein [Tepidisphaeraceae bacterium]